MQLRNEPKLIDKYINMILYFLYILFLQLYIQFIFFHFAFTCFLDFYLCLLHVIYFCNSTRIYWMILFSLINLFL